MQNTKKTAGETAQPETKKGWGIIALIAAMVTCTCFGSLWLTGISAAVFAFCAWKGGYMDETISHKSSKPVVTPKVEEGLAA